MNTNASAGFLFIVVGLAIGVTVSWIAGALMAVAGLLMLASSRRTR